jgi:hypothetical protein
MVFRRSRLGRASFRRAWRAGRAAGGWGRRPCSLAQDAASACRTFSDSRDNDTGECWYNTALGVGYKKMLGRAPNIALIKAKMVSQALLVPGVSSAKVFITGIVDRRVTGQIQVTSVDGVTASAAF